MAKAERAVREASPDLIAVTGDLIDDFPADVDHYAEMFGALTARGVDLTLSGHTHWGQLSVPRFRWCLANPFLRLAMGAHTSGRSLLYIHPGTGYWGLPFRLGHSGQVAIVRLERGEEPGFREA